VEIFIIGKNSPQLSGYEISTCNFNLIDASLDWSTTLPELTDLEWSYTRSFGQPPQVFLTPPELLVLDLKRNSLTAIDNLDFAVAANLEQFDVSHNAIGGTIPASLAADSFITVVELGSNQFSGTVPASFAGDSEIVSFNIGSNLLTGSIPDFGSESLFEFLDVSDNYLSGTIPEYIGDFGAAGEGLLTLLLHDNQLTGSIPSTVSQLTMLDTLFLGNNRLTGPIPDLSALTNIGSLVDSEGANFAGGNLFNCPVPGKSSCKAHFGSRNVSLVFV